MHVKYQVAIFNIAKVANVKVFFRTDGQTDILTDEKFNCYMPPYRGHNKSHAYNCAQYRNDGLYRISNGTTITKKETCIITRINDIFCYVVLH